MSSAAALLVVDLQTGFTTGPPPLYRVDRLLEVVSELQDRARTAGVPVVHTRFEGGSGHPTATGTPGARIDDTVAPEAGEHVVVKQSTDSFHHTDLHPHLQLLGVQRLFVVGCLTELCVDTTCRRGISLGYDVTLVADGHSTVDATLPGGLTPEARLHLVNHVLQRVGTVDRHIELLPSTEIDFTEPVTVR